jgi:hypothetical protein
MGKSKNQKRLNLVLDDVSYSRLEKIKAKHGDSTYTQALKRAIAMLDFIDTRQEEGDELYLSSPDGDKLKEVYFLQ